MLDPVKYALLITTAYELAKQATEYFKEKDEPKLQEVKQNEKEQKQKTNKL